LGLEVIAGFFVIYHFERGERNDIKYFKNEEEATEFIYEYLNKKMNN